MYEYYLYFWGELADYLEKPKPKKLGKRLFNKIAKLYKEEYPNRKPLEYPKSGKLTKKFTDLVNGYNLIV